MKSSILLAAVVIGFAVGTGAFSQTQPLFPVTQQKTIKSSQVSGLKSPTKAHGPFRSQAPIHQRLDAALEHRVFDSNPTRPEHLSIVLRTPQIAEEAYVAKSEDGHFWAFAEIDGHKIRALIDTGASAVALTPEDAKRAGIDLRSLNYNRDVRTAQGVTQAAAVTLRAVSVAGAEVRRVEALVVPKGLSASLLGMSYLGRLEGFDATRDGMILHP